MRPVQPISEAPPTPPPPPPSSVSLPTPTVQSGARTERRVSLQCPESLLFFIWCCVSLFVAGQDVTHATENRPAAQRGSERQRHADHVQRSRHEQLDRDEEEVSGGVHQDPRDQTWIHVALCQGSVLCTTEPTCCQCWYASCHTYS